MSVEGGGRPSTESSVQAETSPSKRPPSIFDWGSPDPLILTRGGRTTQTVNAWDIDSILSSPPGKTNEKKPTGPVSNQGTVVELPGKKGPK